LIYLLGIKVDGPALEEEEPEAVAGFAFELGTFPPRNK
jgi:hypothetical protein